MSTWPQPDRTFEEPLRVLRENSVSLDDASNWPSESLDVLGEAGVLGWVVPREYGGSEYSGPRHHSHASVIPRPGKHDQATLAQTETRRV